MGLLAVSPPVVAEDSRRALPSGPPVAPGDADFNGDGLTDVAFGNTFDIGDSGYEGAVHIMYGTRQD
jgi:hypothetical protein